MKVKIIILIIIISIIAISGCINGSYNINKINQLSPSISEHIHNGDESYNKSATYLNSKNSENSINESENAMNEYNAARTLASESLKYAENEKEDTYINYIKLVILEIDSKLNATTELQEAAKLFRTNKIYYGNQKLKLANEYMQNSKNYNKQKNEIIKQNQNKFK